MSYTYEITTAGKALVAKAQTGAVINFTKVEVGKGDLAGSPAKFTSLLDLVSTNAKIQQKEYIDGSDEAKITITYTNDDIDEGFYVKEIGLYANDPDVGEILFLYCYSEDADYLPVSSYASVEQVVNLFIGIDNASEVTAQILSETNVIRNNFYANSILKADIDSEPEALIVEENRIVGRKEGGEIDDLTPFEARNVLGISGALWDENEDYSLYDRVIGTDGNIYNARKVSGPNNGGTVNPVGDTTLTWTVTEPYMAGRLVELSYVPSVEEMLICRMMPGSAQTLSDADYPEILSKWGGKIYGTPAGKEETHFLAPLYDGHFKRIWANGSENDPDRATRTRKDGQVGDLMGSEQQDQMQEIRGTLSTYAGGGYPTVAGGNGVFTFAGYSNIVTSYSTAGGGYTATYFNNKNSSLPNPAKTSEYQTNPININIWGGFFY